jgi:CysZ protein
LTWVITPLLWLVGSLMTGYVSTLAVLLLTSPFHALLSERVEELVTGEPIPSSDSFGRALLEVPRAFSAGSEKTAGLFTGGTGHAAC